MKTKISYLLLFAISVFLFWLNFQQREFNWDLLGYMGSYYELQSPNDDSKILYKVYSNLKNEAPKPSFEQLNGYGKSGDWMNFVSKNPDAFRQQISYYSIKVLYVALGSVFLKLGFSPAFSFFLPNLLAYFIFGFLLFEIFRIIFRQQIFLPLVFTLLIIALPPVRYLGTIATPDMLIVLFSTWFILAIFKKQNLWFQALILLLIVLTRPDMVLFALSYLGFYFLFDLFKNKKWNFSTIISAIIIFCIYIGILKINNYPGWNDVFYDSFLQRRNFLTEPAIFSFQDYKDVLFSNLYNFKKIGITSVLLLLTVLFLSQKLRIRLFAIMVFFNIFLKFVFFPAPGEFRFFLPFLLILFVLAVHVINKRTVQM